MQKAQSLPLPFFERRNQMRLLARGDPVRKAPPATLHTSSILRLMRIGFSLSRTASLTGPLGPQVDADRTGLYAGPVACFAIYPLLFVT